MRGRGGEGRGGEVVVVEETHFVMTGSNPITRYDFLFSLSFYVLIILLSCIFKA